MAVTEKEVHRIAELARVKLSADEYAQYGQEINKIIGWIDQLQEVNTDNVQSMQTVLSSLSELAPDLVTKLETGEHKLLRRSWNALPMRKDVVTDGGLRDEILKNAPKSHYGYFVMPFTRMP